MRRRALIFLLGGIAAYPLTTRVAAQGTRRERAAPFVIGLTSPFFPADAELWHQAFRQGLRDLGWVEGTNVKIEYRYAGGRSEILPELVGELIDLKIDVIVVSVTPNALVAVNATKTI